MNDSITNQEKELGDDLFSDLKMEIDDYENAALKNYKEDYHVGIKGAFLTIGIVSIIYSTVAITALRRTRKVPPSAKFLATGLLLFDTLFIIITTVRKFVYDSYYNMGLVVLGMMSAHLQYLTICMMSVERLFVFYRPMIYMRVCTREFLRSVAMTVWVSELVVFLMVRYGVCYLNSYSTKVFYEAGFCNNFSSIYYIFLVVFVLAISMACYIKIFHIVREKKSRKDPSRRMSILSVIETIRQFKTTSLILMYLLVILCSSLAYAALIVYVRFNEISLTELRLSLDTVSLVNTLFDPFLYVLWFKECQMEVLKIFGCIDERIRARVRKMQIDIFDIVTYQKSRPTSSRTGSFSDVNSSSESIYNNRY